MATRTPRSSLRILTAAAIVVVLTGGACEDDDDVIGPGEEVTFTQVDRFGLPAINTVFIPTAMKQDFNRSVPANDRAQFRDEALATLNAFGITGARPRVSRTPSCRTFSRSTRPCRRRFLNGRKPTDDVITVAVDADLR